MLLIQPLKLSLAACQIPTPWKKMRAGAKVMAISTGTSNASPNNRQSRKPCACSGVTVRVSGSWDSKPVRSHRCSRPKQINRISVNRQSTISPPSIRGVSR
ncbi:hypothetical protein D3C80_1799090 [compost metagenome]